MAEHEHAAIQHNDHLLLEQPLLRLPNELLRKNFRSVHLTIEKDTSSLKTFLKDSANTSASGRAPPGHVLKNLDSMLARLRGVKRKLSAYADEESRLHDSLEARIAHLHELYSMSSVHDVKYEAWSRKRLDRLIADYFLRNGFHESARMLSTERDMEQLVDCETFAASGKIRTALLNGSVQEALAWCQENKKELRKMDSELEFMLRFQQYIELIRDNKVVEAIAHAKKYLIPHRSLFPKEMQKAYGVLAIKPSPDPKHVYADVYRPRWAQLADLFTRTHHQLLALPSVPLLHIALASGLSALKTPVCHSFKSSGDIVDNGITRGVCPICSIELNNLARHVPYAHHTKSYVQPDLVVLPSRLARGRHVLLEEARKAGLQQNHVKDTVTGQIYHIDHLPKVYIT